MRFSLFQREQGGFAQRLKTMLKFKIKKILFGERIGRYLEIFDSRTLEKKINILKKIYA